VRTNAHELPKSAGGPEDRVEVEEHVVRGCEALSWPGTDEANYLSYAHIHARMELNRCTYVFYYPVAYSSTHVNIVYINK
jgi:hypothetical protein